MSEPDGGTWSRLDRPPLREAALRRALVEGPAPSWRSLDVADVTGSTNADLVARARAGEPGGAVLVADHQTSGRGRRDRSWESPPRAGIALSVLLRPTAPPERWAWLALLGGVALVDALRRTCGVPAVLKWPNDVLVPQDGAAGGPAAKVAGLLAEVVPGSAGPAGVVLGIGLNVTQGRDELPVPTATSLRLAGAASSDRDTVLRAVLRALAVRYDAWDAVAGDPVGSGVAAGYREVCDTIGREVRAELPGGDVLTGRAEGVDDAGRLLVLPPGAAAPVAMAAGDVVHIRPAATTGPPEEA